MGLGSFLAGRFAGDKDGDARVDRVATEARLRLSQQATMTRNAESVSGYRSVELMAVIVELNTAMRKLGEFKQHYLAEKANRIDNLRDSVARGRVIKDITGKSHEEMLELTKRCMEEHKEAIDKIVEEQNKINWDFAEDQIAKNNLKDQMAKNNQKK